MKTIALAIQKGGVGKTSLAVSLAVDLARETKSVLLIDLDPQGSASNWIGPRQMSAELADALFGKVALDAAIVKTGVPGLSLLPSAGLGGELNLYAKTLAGQQDRCIRKVTREAAGMGFRFCVLDTSPAFGALEWAALMATDEVITPILPDSFAADGLSTFAENLKKFREDKETGKPFYKRLLINGIDRRIPQHRDTLTTMKGGGGSLAVYEIPVDPAFRKGQAAGVPVQELTGAKKETLAELKRLARDLIEEEKKE
jgi:chromosome partitioning protein